MENNPNAPHEIHYKKAVAAFKLGEIYEANVHVRRAMELNPSDEIINLAKEIKSAMGQKALQRAKQFKETKQWSEALEEAKKA